MMEERSGHRSLLHFLCAAAFPPLAIAMSCLFVVHRKLLSSATGKRVKRPVGAHPPPHRPPARCAAGASVKTASCALRPRYGKAPMRLGRTPPWRTACTRRPACIAMRCSEARNLHARSAPATSAASPAGPARPRPAGWPSARRFWILAHLRQPFRVSENPGPIQGCLPIYSLIPRPLETKRHRGPHAVRHEVERAKEQRG